MNDDNNSNRAATLIAGVERIVHPVLRAHDLNLFDLSLRREQSGMVLRVTVDAERGVSVDVCADVSRDLSPALDVADIIPFHYTLEVTSPGADRPLRNAADFSRFKGRTAKIVWIDPSTSATHVLRGVISGADELAATIEGSDGSKQPVEHAHIKSAHLTIDLGAKPKPNSKTATKQKKRA